MTSPVVRCEDSGPVRVLEIDFPPVNTLALPVRESLLRELRRIARDSSVKGVVLACAGRSFSTGADLKELDGEFPPPRLPEVIDELEALPIPVVVALHGYALGGGLEVALGCHWRIASRDCRLGLPEVTLGLLPGAGGTQRLPRLIAADVALDLMLTGRQISAQNALDVGLLDELVDAPGLRAAAIDRASMLARTNAPLRRASRLPLSPDAADRIKRYLATVPPPGTLAARHLIACVEAAVTAVSFVAGRRVEDRLFDELRSSSESQALRYLFFGERDVAKLGDLGKARADTLIAHLRRELGAAPPGDDAWLDAAERAARAALAATPGASPIEIDVAAVRGLGYPRQLGGPLFRAGLRATS